MKKKQLLNQFLDQLQTDFHREDYLSSDPLEFVHRFKDPFDQEAVALLSSVLAYGKVKQIRNSIEIALTKMKQLASSPHEFVQQIGHPQFRSKALHVFQNYVHRFNCGSDLIHLFWLLNQSWSKYGSLGGHFLSYLEAEDSDISQALNSLIKDWRSWASSRVTPSFHYLLTAPQDGSCCKRWCMFLRWMGRKDQLDLGLWTRHSPLKHTFPKGKDLKAHQLVMPLDTHTGRISQYLGLTPRKSLNWKAALEVTESLKKLDPQDPTRYDFAIARLGILDLCQKKYRQEICKKCQLLPVCHFAIQRSNGALESTLSLA